MARPASKALRRAAAPLWAAEQVHHYYEANYVIDASVVYKWYGAEEEGGTEAQALRSRFYDKRIQVHAPELLLIEVGNALRFNRQLTETSVATYLKDLAGMGLTLHTLTPDLLRRMNALSWKYNLSMYDALYLAIAEQTGAPLITADEQMLKQVQGHALALSLSKLHLS